MEIDPRETELLRLCDRYSRQRSMDSLHGFFARVIGSQRKLELTDGLRPVLPMLATIQDGSLINMLNNAIDGITPMHFVPDLTFAPKPPKTKTRATARHIRTSNTARDLSELPVRELTAISARKSRRSLSEKPKIMQFTATAGMRARRNEKIIARMTHLPPLVETDEDVVSQLYVAPESAFFICKKDQPKDMTMKVIPPAYPKHVIGESYSVITSRGVVTMDGSKGDTSDLMQHIKDKACSFLTTRQEFRRKYSYRTYYLWVKQYKNRLFMKRIQTLDNLNAVSFPNFQLTIARICEYMMPRIDAVIMFPSEFEMKMDDAPFGEYQVLSDRGIIEMEGVVTLITAESDRILAKFFDEIKAVSLLMQLNFSELNALDTLPDTLKKYASDLQWKTPSLYQDRVRDAELLRQRVLATDREKYLSAFFVRANAVVTGKFIYRARDMILGFLDRFDASRGVARRVLKFTGHYSSVVGVSISPPKEEFQAWIMETVDRIRRIFLAEDKGLAREVIEKMDPSFEFEFEDPMIVLGRFTEVTSAIERVIRLSDEAYDFFEEEFRVHVSFVRSLTSAIDRADEFTDLRDVEKLNATVEPLLQAQDDMTMRPRNVFHRTTLTGESRPDIVVDVRSAWEVLGGMLDTCLRSLRERACNELNNTLFLEIQDMWSGIKDKKITRAMCSSMEARMLLASIMAVSITKSWPDTKPECRDGLDTIMRLYQQLADKTRFTHNDAAVHFNEAAHFLGVQIVRIQEEEEDSDEEEVDGSYEYVDGDEEEENGEDAASEA